MAPKNLDKVAAIKVKSKTNKATPPTTTIDPWDQAFADAQKARTATTTPTTTVPPVGSTVIPKASALPKGYKPIGSQPAPEGTIGINAKGNFFLGTGKVVKKENFKPASSNVIYNPGTRIKALATKTPAPVTPSTTIPKTSSTTSGGRKPIETSAEAAKLLTAQEKRAANLQITPVEAIKAQGEEKPKGVSSFLSRVVNFDLIPGKKEFKPIARALIPSIQGAQTGLRAVLGTSEETIDTIRQVIGKAEKYQPEDYIPVHQQTGVPIAKVGDYYIRNWTDLVNKPIDIPKNATPEQKIKATTDLIKSKGRTTAGSAKDALKAAQDFSYSASDNPYVPSTGNPIVDGIIDFAYDVLLDPVTYATLGGSALVSPAEQVVTKGGTAVVKGVGEVASKAAIKAGEREAARVAAEAAAAAARAAAGTAGEAAANATAKTAAKVAEDLFKEAAAVAPRRVYGRAAREALANQVRTIRQSAQAVIDDAASSVAEKTIAENAVKVLTDDFIKDVAAKGYSVIRGEAAKTLGVRSGARIGLPGFGKKTIPYTAKLSEFVGSTLSKGRFAFFQSKAGQAVLQTITPTGQGGLFGTEALLKMRTALRNGTATAEEAVDYTTLLSVDKYHRGALDLARKKSSSTIYRITNGKSAKILKGLSEHLVTPESEWVGKGLRVLNKEEQVVFDSVKKTLNEFWKEANSKAARLGADVLPPLTNYWPRSQSEAAMEWAAKNAKEVDNIASGLGVDRTFFLGNFTDRTLQKGKLWFGQVLDGTESIYDLNKIAKDSGLIDFNFFETDPIKALVGYTNTHANYLAYADAIEKLTKISPSKLGGLAEDITTKTAGINPAIKPGISDLGSLENTVANFMSAERLANWSEAQILTVRDSILELKSKLAGSSDIVKKEFDNAVMEIDEKIAETTRLINSGVIDPTVGSLLSAELETYANDLALAISNTKRDFIVTNPSRWKNVGKVLEDGFVVLNNKTMPDIAVRADIAEIFKNVKRLDDPKFVKYAEAVLKDYNTFFKSAVTTTLGFHIRNTLSNAFIMFAAGADPINLIKGLRIYKQWRAASKAGLSPEKFIDNLVAKGFIKETESKAVLDAIAYSGATGYGQIGEIASAAGIGRPGFTGQAATGKIPFTKIESQNLRKASEIAGLPFYGSRKLGNFIEEFNRFQLTYDGLMQGYDAATAAARTSKFLIDYNDLSTADRAIKQIIPFWVWTSRNMPLQIENMWLNPKAYTIYDKFKNNFEDKQGTSAFLPEYLKGTGAFKLPETSSFEIPGTGAIPGRGGKNIGVGIGPDAYLKPDLGFPGAGNASPLQQIFSGDATQILSSLNPLLRAPIEIVRPNPEAADTNSIQESGRQFYGDIPIPKSISPFEYLIAQGVPGLSTLGRFLSIIPGTEPKQVQELTGSKADSELQATLSFIGSPQFKLLDKTQKNEVWRRYYLLKKYINNVVKKRKEESRKK